MVCGGCRGWCGAGFLPRRGGGSLPRDRTRGPTAWSLESAVAGARGRRFAPRPLRRGLVGSRQHLAPRPLGARLDLLLGGVQQPLLPLLGLAADPFGLRPKLLLGPRPRLLLGLAFDLLHQPADALLGLAAD